MSVKTDAQVTLNEDGSIIIDMSLSRAELYEVVENFILNDRLYSMKIDNDMGGSGGFLVQTELRHDA